MALSQFIAPALQGLATTAALTGGAGFIGSGGQLSGIGAGMMGSIGGGTRGGFSGGVLGALAGSGFMAAAFLHPGTRKLATSFFGKVLGSQTMLAKTTAIANHPMTKSIAKHAPSWASDWAAGLGRINAYPEMYAGFNSPQQAAVAHTMSLLKRKELMARGMMWGAAGGAVGGMLVGGPAGTMVSAYNAGRRQR